METLPIEIIDYICKYIPAINWLNLTMTNKYFNNMFSKKYKHNKIKQIIQEKCDIPKNIIYIGKQKYYRCKQNYIYNYNYDIPTRVYCYDCSLQINLRDIKKNIHSHICYGNTNLLCIICGIPTEYHMTINKKCALSMTICKYCNKIMYMYQIKWHLFYCNLNKNLKK